MTEHELSARLSALAEALRHIEAHLEDARTERREHHAALTGLKADVAVLQAAQVRNAPLPDQIAENAKVAAADSAYAKGAHDAIAEVKRTVMIWFALPGFIVSAVAAFVLVTQSGVSP